MSGSSTTSRSASRATSPARRTTSSGLARRPDGGRRGGRAASTPSSTSRHGPASTTPSATRSATFEANVAWSVGLLEAARLAGVRRFVFASSNAAAGDHEPPSDETDLPHPRLAVRRLQARDRGVLPGLRRDVRAGRLLAAVLERLRPELAPQAQRRRGLAAGRARGRADHHPRRRRADARLRLRRRPRRRPSRAALDAPEDSVAGELFQAGTGVETTDRRARRRRSAGRSGRQLEIVHGPARGRRRPAQRQPRRQGRARSSAIGRRSRLDDGLARTADWFKAALAEPALAGVTPHAASGSE